MKPETVFRINKVDKFLRTLQNTASHSIQQIALRGDADKFLCCNGHFIWLEIKTDDGVEEPLQEYKRSEISRCKGIVIVARPHNWEGVKNFLKLLDRGIYDKNVLRGIEFGSVSPGSAKIGPASNEDAASIQGKAYRKASKRRA